MSPTNQHNIMATLVPRSAPRRLTHLRVIASSACSEQTSVRLNTATCRAGEASFKVTRHRQSPAVCDAEVMSRRCGI